jgi:membrane protease YdiL (CAAX protease family)
MEGDDIRPGAGRIYRSAWTVYLLLAIAGAVWMGLANRDEGGLAPGMLFDPATWALDLLWGLAGGALLLAVWLVGRTLLPLARELEQTLADLLGGLDLSQTLALALISGFAEEVFFRGAVQGSFGIVPATLVFALLHGGPGRPFLLWTLFALAAGAVFGGLALTRGNLLAPIVAHVLVNAVNLRRLARQGERAGTAPGSASPPGG